MFSKSDLENNPTPARQMLQKEIWLEHHRRVSLIFKNHKGSGDLTKQLQKASDLYYEKMDAIYELLITNGSDSDSDG